MRRVRMIQAVIEDQSMTEVIASEQLSRAPVSRELASDEYRHLLTETDELRLGAGPETCGQLKSRYRSRLLVPINRGL